jgi:hypothetical protein
MYSQIHPKMREDGSYPRDFNMALTLDQFEALDSEFLRACCDFDQELMKL